MADPGGRRGAKKNMSHSRVSLSRIAFPCITGGVEGRLGDQGRGGVPEKAPGPACRARR